MASSGAKLTVSLLLGVLMVVLVPVRTQAATIDDTIPPSLLVPAGNVVQQMLFATGVQIYIYNGTTWTLNNVSADLYNHKGLKVGYHYFLGQRDSNGGQPTWATLTRSTSVTGRAIVSLPVESDSINWVLLQATSNTGRPKFFGVTTYIQRLYTQHGKAPSATVPATAGDVFNSSYTALYKYSTNATSPDLGWFF